MREEYYRVGDWLFLSGQGLLRSEGGGVEVMLTPRAAQLLACLVGRAGEVLGRDELIDGAWARAEVTDHALTQAIFELRQALRGEREDAPCYIQTVPKRGYRLAVPVEHCTGPLPVAGLPDVVRTDEEAVAAVSAIDRAFGRRHPALLASVLLLVALSFAAVFLWHARSSVPAQDSLPNTRRIVIHLESTDDERLAALQYGLGGFAAHILTVRTPYEMVQIMKSGEGPHCRCQSSARVLGLSVERVGGGDFLRARFEHRLRGQLLFDKRYPLYPLDETMSALGADLLVALHYPKPARPLAEPYADCVPDIESFFRAYYRMSMGDAASLRMAHATLVQLTARPMPRSDLLALRGIVELALSNLDTGEGGRWLETADATFDILDRQEGAPEFAYPIVLEASAMHALYQGRQAEGVALIEQSLRQSETWHAQIVRGKLAELAGRLDEAADAYSRAYLLKPDPGTLDWIVRVGYDTDLAEVCPLLATRMAGMADIQMSGVED
ncbi:winged helix-turn-helix domain-containing protein [Crenobacter intestini]|uniref:OmpR/PhoB-type domain-containing protein n=1 Tax=Crenobacter intestini TaxID=2563443 RepID=A0A4T0UWM7_9NEIS|nr:winged helix-turn-helix domain-containing protein [Crenobacter intestini]TIC83469.1 hypothetical protein E5K04_07890 [Crenobacter intestini]